MNKQELKEEVGKLNLVVTEFESDGMCYMDRAVSVTQVYDLIDQLDEPEKVVIPKLVADWIEHCKGNDLDLYEAFGHSDMSVEVSDLVGDMDADILARAWLDGYEVEKEKLYYVIDKSKRPILTIYEGKVTPSVSVSKVERAEKLSSPVFKYRFTEKEIKEYDERFWPFAVEVDE